MKQLLLSVVLVATSLAFAQNQQNQNWCGFDEHNYEMYEKYPGAEQLIQETIMRNREMYLAGGEDRTNIGIVPVVVHVIHDGGESNISYDQIVSAIDQVNEDWQRLNSDSVNTRNTAQAPFEPLAANMQIEFKLARLDPQGECTNGVERRYSPGATINASDDVKHYNSGGMDAWPRTKYLNIWVVESIESGGAGVTLGYAQFPYFGQASEYGVVIRHDAMGTIGTASGDRTLSHEIGHCFGLFHTFEGGCSNQDCGSNGDFCCDTPPVSDAQWSCSSTQNTCTGVPTNDHYGFDAYDQFENYMSYSPCQNMFSQDQKDIVHGNFSNITFMTSLISGATATATGVNLPDVLCQAEFSSSNTVICAGDAVDFTDLSYFGVTGRTWTFNGGNPANSTLANPTVIYSTPGVYDVTLEVTDGSNNETTTQTAYITVLADPGSPIPFSEGFEPYSSLPDNATWFIENDNAGVTWELNDQYAASGNNSAYIDNFGQNTGSSDHLIVKPLDLSVVSGDTYVLTFKYAYKKRSASNDEWLWLKVSSDCGENWTTKKVMHGSTLSEEVSSVPYFPSEEDWIEVSVPGLTSSYSISNFRFKFQFDNDNGNNIFIDDINLYATSMTSVNEQIADNLSVYPNPVSDQMNIIMDVYADANYTITLNNAMGQQLAVVYQGELKAGPVKMLYSMDQLATGVYFLNIESNGVTRTTKVLKQ